VLRGNVINIMRLSYSAECFHNTFNEFTFFHFDVHEMLLSSINALRNKSPRHILVANYRTMLWHDFLLNHQTTIHIITGNITWANQQNATPP